MTDKWTQKDICPDCKIKMNQIGGTKEMYIYKCSKYKQRFMFCGACGSTHKLVLQENE